MSDSAENPQKDAFNATLPWYYTYSSTQSEIEAIDPTTGAWETIAIVNGFAGFDAEEIADLITQSVYRQKCGP